MVNITTWSEFFITFSFNVSLALLLLAIYCLLYKTESFKRLHSSRMFSDEKDVPKKSMHNPFSWLYPVWKATEDEIIRDAGLDAAVFLRMFYFSIQILVALSVLCIPILLPLHSSGQELGLASQNTVDALSSSNVAAKSKHLWANFILLWVMSGLICGLMWVSYRQMWELRHNFLALRARSHHPEEYTLLLSDVPDKDTGNTGITSSAPTPSSSISVAGSVSHELLLGHSDSERGSPFRLFLVFLRTFSLGILRPPVRVQRSSALKQKQRQIDLYFTRLYGRDFLCHQGVTALGKSQKLYKSWFLAVRQLRRAVWKHQSLKEEPREIEDRPKEELRKNGSDMLNFNCMNGEPFKVESFRKVKEGFDESQGSTVSLQQRGFFASPSNLATPSPLRSPPHSPTSEASHATSPPRSFASQWLWWAKVLPPPSPSPIGHCLEIVKQRARALRREQKRDRNRRVTSSAFVSFHSRRVSTVALQTIHSVKGSTWRLQAAPEPRDVVWSNVGLKLWESTLRRHIGLLLTVALVIFFYIPVTFVAGLTSVDKLLKLFPGLKKYVNKHWFSGFLSSFLPSLSLRVILWIVPPLLQLLSHLQGCVSVSEGQRIASTRHFYVLLFNVFLGYTFTGTLFQQLQAILDHPQDLVKILGTSIPQTSSFFINYVVISSLLFAIELLRFPLPFLKWIWLSLTAGRENADREKLWKQEGIAYHVFVPYQNLVLTFGFVFAVIAPLMLPFVLLYSVIGYFVWKHQVLYVYTPKYQTGGLMWPHFVNHVFVALILAQLTSIGEFGLKLAYYQAAWSVLLVFGTSYFWLMMNNQFGDSFKVLPLELACAVDVDNNKAGATPKKEDILVQYTPQCLRDFEDNMDYRQLLEQAEAIATAEGVVGETEQPLEFTESDEEEEAPLSGEHLHDGNWSDLATSPKTPGTASSFHSQLGSSSRM